MKTYIYRSFTLLTVLFLLSCRNNNHLQHSVEAMIGQEVILPAEIAPALDGRLMPNMDLLSATTKLIVWYDSTGCSPCRVQQMHQWYDITSYAGKKGGDFNIIFIFTPRREERIEASLLSFKYPVYIDKESKFIKDNAGVLPQEEVLHTFLLDKDNKIVMVGNPVQNEALWNLYKEQIQLLLRD